MLYRSLGNSVCSSSTWQRPASLFLEERNFTFPRAEWPGKKTKKRREQKEGIRHSVRQWQNTAASTTTRTCHLKKVLQICKSANLASVITVAATETAAKKTRAERSKGKIVNQKASAQRMSAKEVSQVCNRSQEYKPKDTVRMQSVLHYLNKCTNQHWATFSTRKGRWLHLAGPPASTS